MHQTLAPDGTLLSDLGPELSAERMLAMYRWMLFGRAFEQRAVILQRQGQIAVFTPISGQEAAYVGSAIALESGDWVAPSYRDFLPCCINGLSPTTPWWFFRGDPRGGWIPDGVRVLPLQVVLAAHLPHAVGVGMALRYQSDPGVVIAYFGDGASSEGDFHEALNLAGVAGAPVIFFCTNNQWAISTPRRLQSASESIAIRAAGYGIAGEQVDGMDALAVYSVTRKAVQRARSGGGPTLIEAVAYRLGAHTTVDDPRAYRNEAEVEPWRAKDPLRRMQSFLTARGLLTATDDAALLQSVTAEVQAAFEATMAAGPPDPRWMFDYLNVQTPAAVRRQRAEMVQAYKLQGGD